MDAEDALGPVDRANDLILSCQGPLRRSRRGGGLTAPRRHSRQVAGLRPWGVASGNNFGMTGSRFRPRVGFRLRLSGNDFHPSGDVSLSCGRQLFGAMAAAGRSFSPSGSPWPRLPARRRSPRPASSSDSRNQHVIGPLAWPECIGNHRPIGRLSRRFPPDEADFGHFERIPRVFSRFEVDAVYHSGTRTYVDSPKNAEASIVFRRSPGSRPVTPEVAGSSPVILAELKPRDNRGFCVSSAEAVSGRGKCSPFSVLLDASRLDSGRKWADPGPIVHPHTDRVVRVARIFGRPSPARTR